VTTCRQQSTEKKYLLLSGAQPAATGTITQKYDDWEKASDEWAVRDGAVRGSCVSGQLGHLIQDPKFSNETLGYGCDGSKLSGHFGTSTEVYKRQFGPTCKYQTGMSHGLNCPAIWTTIRCSGWTHFIKHNIHDPSHQGQ